MVSSVSAIIAVGRLFKNPDDQLQMKKIKNGLLLVIARQAWIAF
jgi:hypothetical protein